MSRMWRTNRDPIYKIGDLIRYDTGSTALLEITSVQPGHGGSVAYYHGKQCMGGSAAAYHQACELASDDDIATWQECAEWRDLAAGRSLSKWTPTTDPLTLRRMGKLSEELGELQAVVARVVIQGIDETDPGTGKVNRQRLIDELADVQAQIGCTVLAFDLNQGYLQRRVADKMRQMQEWEAMFAASGVAGTVNQQENGNG